VKIKKKTERQRCPCLSVSHAVLSSVFVTNKRLRNSAVGLEATLARDAMISSVIVFYISQCRQLSACLILTRKLLDRPLADRLKATRTETEEGLGRGSVGRTWLSSGHSLAASHRRVQLLLSARHSCRHGNQTMRLSARTSAHKSKQSNQVSTMLKENHALSYTVWYCGVSISI